MTILERRSTVKHRPWHIVPFKMVNTHSVARTQQRWTISLPWGLIISPAILAMSEIQGPWAWPGLQTEDAAFLWTSELQNSRRASSFVFLPHLFLAMPQGTRRFFLLNEGAFCLFHPTLLFNFFFKNLMMLPPSERPHQKVELTKNNTHFFQRHQQFLEEDVMP